MRRYHRHPKKPATESEPHWVGTVSIRMRETQDSLIDLSVYDDGTQIERASSGQRSTSGLGTITLDQVAVRWARDTTAAGTMLDVWLPRLVR